MQDERRRQRDRKPVSDPRIAALVKAHRPGDAIVYVLADAETPRRRVTVVYSRERLEALTHRPLGRTLVEMESAFVEAGITYAIVEEDEQRAFARLLDDALSAARDA